MNKFYDALYKGVSDGFVEFINYFLVMQGLGDMTTLVEEDMELLLNLFVSTVNTEIDSLVFNLTKTNPYYDLNKTDDNLQDKVAHLTQNLLVLLSLEFENMINGSDSNSNDNQDNNNGFCGCLSKLILNLLIMLEQTFGLPQDMFVNDIASELLSSYISTNLMNERCDSSSNNNFMSGIEGLISSAISNKVSKVKNQLSNATKNRKRRAIYDLVGDILPKKYSSSNKLSLNINKEHKVEHKKSKRDSMTPIIRLLMKHYYQ